jgi:hypothetical protein
MEENTQLKLAQLEAYYQLKIETMQDEIVNSKE